MRRLLSCSLIVVLVHMVACGGQAGAPAKTQDDAAKTEAKGDKAPGEAQPAAPSGPRKPSCSDGSCFECGDGICPSGFYCEATRAGAACAWAPSCAQKPSCACLSQQLKGCTCEEKGGGPHVKCG